MTHRQIVSVHDFAGPENGAESETCHRGDVPRIQDAHVRSGRTGVQARQANPGYSFYSQHGHSSLVPISVRARIARAGHEDIQDMEAREAREARDNRLMD